MILLYISAALFFGLLLSWLSIRHMFDDIKTPLVEPAPDTFPLHYRSPYVQQHIGMEGFMNGRPWRRDNEGNPIFGYQPRIDPNRALLSPPQSHSVICKCDECMKSSLLNGPIDLALIGQEGGKPINYEKEFPDAYPYSVQHYQQKNAETRCEQDGMAMECEVRYE